MLNPEWEISTIWKVRRREDFKGEDSKGANFGILVKIELLFEKVRGEKRRKKMCLAIPSKVLSINREENSAEVDTLGVKRVVSLDLLGEPVEVGEYLLIHVGYAMGKIDEKSALESLEIYRQLAEAALEDNYPISPEELVTADGPLLYTPPEEEKERGNRAPTPPERG